MTSLKVWFMDPNRNKEALSSMDSPKSFCDFYDRCTTISKRNCKRCLDNKRRNEHLIKVFKDGS
jgi:hypothetical protein